MDAQYIADIVKPLITQMESEVDIHNKRSPGIVDLGIFMETAMFRILAWSSRLSILGSLLAMMLSMVSLCSSLTFTRRYHSLKAVWVLQSGKKYLWLSLAQPQGNFEQHSRQHNHGIYLGFIKPSECKMAGANIGLLRLLWLKNALRSTIMSKEWIDLRIFYADNAILMNLEFWKLLFVICGALCAPVRWLCLEN